MKKNLLHLLGSVLVLSFGLSACGGSDETQPMTKDEVKEASKADDWFDNWPDFCEVYNWYLDSECDTFCHFPDPDCPADNATIITQEDNDKSIDVLVGKDVIIRLKGNPSTAYEWTIKDLSKSMGDPHWERFVPNNNTALGAEGLFEFGWHTNVGIPPSGENPIKLVYARSWDKEANDTFSVIINFIDEEEIPFLVLIEKSGNEQTFDVFEGQEIIVQLEGENPSLGYEWKVVRTDREFGSPYISSFKPYNEEETDGPGLFEFVWKSKGRLTMIGEHTVILSYKKQLEEDILDTFQFTVNIMEMP